MQFEHGVKWLQTLEILGNSLVATVLSY